MAVAWTIEQKQVIASRGKSLLVSAAAGSGKTAVLVARILSRIMDPDDPVDVDRLLVVTFTNAAAAGMRERITAAIEDALQSDPDNSHLQRQSALIHNAQITTIHSFCLQLIRSHFHAIDLEPDFRVADTGELHLLKEEVFAAILEECFEEKEASFLSFVENYSSGRNEDAIRDMVFSLYEQAVSNPWPEEWLQESARCYDVPDEAALSKQDWYQKLMSDLCLHAKESVRELEGLLAITMETDGPASYEAALREDLFFFRSLTDQTDYAFWCRALSEYQFPSLKADRKFQGSIEKKEAVKNRRDRIKEQTRKWKETYFKLPLSGQLESIRETRRMYLVLCELTERFSRAFAAQKRKNRMVDFSDIEHFALRILLDPATRQPTEIAAEYQNKFREVMIDEYQDSNYVQEALLSAVSGDSRGIRNRFMVGDIKQSIYRFRLARPELFLEKYESYAAGSNGQERIDLRQNFRSRQEILDFSNRIFSGIMQADIGNVRYDDAAALRHGREDGSDPEGNYRPEILLIDDTEAAGEQNKKEAAVIADRIRRMVKDAEIPGLSYGDIVILTRAPSGVAEIYQQVFHDADIPLLLETKTGYFSAREVQQVLALLQVIDNPMQDIPLAAAMKSPFGGFCSEELAQIRIAHPGIPFYEAVAQYGEESGMHAPSGGTENLTEKVIRFLNMVASFRQMMRDMPVYRLLEEIYLSTGFVDEVSALPAGRQRKANLDMLMEKAIAFSKTSYQGLLHFNKYIERLKRYEVDFGEAEIPDDGAQAVRLMSIHKSKGLEFPVVFVAGTGKKLNERDLSGTLVIHPDFGCGLRNINRQKRIKNDTLLRMALSADLKKANLGEEMRVLYVALTRAEKKLILTGSMKQEAAQQFLSENVTAPPGFSKRFQARCYLEWILMSLSEKEREMVSFLSDEAISEIELQRKKAVRADQNTLYRDAYRAADPEITDALVKAFAWRYPYPDAHGRQQKISVSEIKHRAYEENRKSLAADPQASLFPEEILHPYIPKFMQEDAKPDGARYGTAMHFVLQNLDFAQLPEAPEKRPDYIRNRLEILQRESNFDPHTLQMLSVKKLCGFAASGLAERMRIHARKGRLFLEQPFVMSIRESETKQLILPEREEGFSGKTSQPDEVLTQGIIDAFWVEEDGIVLLDYKTDRINEPQELIERYGIQLDLYQEALNRRFPALPVKECWIYSFWLEKAIAV